MVEKLNMQKSEIQIVWFKRDLRISDHKPFFKASENKIPTLPIYIVEPEYWRQPFANRRHWYFINDSLRELREDLKKNHQNLFVRVGSVTNIFQKILLKYHIKRIYAHEETGNQWTFDRDVDVQQWCKKNKIILHEYPTNGVVRGLKNRSEWSQIRNARMKEKLVEVPVSIRSLKTIEEGIIPQKDDPIFKYNFNGQVQRGGRKEALKILNSFLDQRGKGYLSNISAPGGSEIYGSRISPHLT